MDKILNFPGYAYSLYQDKNREIPVEFADGQGTPGTSSYGDLKGDLLGLYGNVNMTYVYVILAISFVIYLVLLYFSVRLAMILARNQGEMILHVGFAIINPPVYLLIALISQVWHYAGSGAPIAY